MKSNKILPISKKLIGLKTIHKNQNEICKALDLVQNLAKSSGFETQNLEHSGSQMLWGSNSHFSNPDFLLLCHIDVVSAPNKLFVPKISGDKLIGRGAFDMKAVSTASLAALFRVKTNKTLQFLFTSDEEIGGASANEFFAAQKLVPKIVLIPDGTQQNQLDLKQKGPAHLVIQVDGKSAHASKPWLGNNPIDTLFSIKSQIESKWKLASADTEWKPTITATNLSVNSSINQISQTGEMTLDLRLTKANQMAEIKQIIVNHRAKVIKQFGDGKVFTQHQNPIIKNWINTSNNSNLKLGFSPGGSDARHVPKNATTIVTQTRGGGAHSNNEWVSISSLKQFSNDVEEFITSL